MKIDVTRDDITQGEPRNPCACPVALALQRHQIAAIVSKSFIRIRSEKTTVLNDVYTPSSVAAFIARFDVGLPVLPFSFEIDVPTSTP